MTYYKVKKIIPHGIFIIPLEMLQAHIFSLIFHNNPSEILIIPLEILTIPLEILIISSGIFDIDYPTKDINHLQWDI